MDNSQGQKIIAALYLVTSHLADSDPIKGALRESAVDLVDAALRPTEQTAALIETLLGAAVLARLVSEKNASIITLETRRFVSGVSLHAPSVEAFFGSTSGTESTIKSPSFSGMSVKPLGQKTGSTIGQNKTTSPYTANKSESTSEKKDKRQATILSFIIERTSATIKDIAVLFPDTSEKTIQRELGVLVASGRITKRGSKRWSVYMAK